MSEIYRKFCPNEPCYSFDENMASLMYQFESTGSPKLILNERFNNQYNGFLVGKHWMDATIKMWREDIENGNLTTDELLVDFPEWFLKKVNIL